MGSGFISTTEKNVQFFINGPIIYYIKRLVIDSIVITLFGVELIHFRSHMTADLDHLNKLFPEPKKLESTTKKSLISIKRAIANSFL